jgi:hypothetical protein
MIDGVFIIGKAEQPEQLPHSIPSAHLPLFTRICLTLPGSNLIFRSLVLCHSFIF